MLFGRQWNSSLHAQFGISPDVQYSPLVHIGAPLPDDVLELDDPPDDEELLLELLVTPDEELLLEEDTPDDEELLLVELLVKPDDDELLLELEDELEEAIPLEPDDVLLITIGIHLAILCSPVECTWHTGSLLPTKQWNSSFTVQSGTYPAQQKLPFTHFGTIQTGVRVAPVE